MRVALIILCLVLSSTTTSSAQTLEDALSLETEGKSQAAIKIFKKLAESGNGRAKFFLGYRYLKGQGVPQSVEMADQYLEPLKKNQVAFFKEEEESAVKLAVFIGIECIRNSYLPDARAREWFLLAEKLSKPTQKSRTQAKIASFYERASENHPYLIDQAIYWYRKARGLASANLLTLRFRICERLHFSASLDRDTCMYQEEFLFLEPSK
ncbi:MAG: sel1 repeat family protein [Rhodospirillales bacterium]|jgi:TPR repeat protein|nr:sel1 repeat family protein [Rhodospirillales bacterium]MBT3905735.1 sel1 repeat family protein [Rhodospirillaceae bacterium]MBT5034086.1 sel1 repeat family protein [Rhodospirillaceae bacterium]MBT6218872.1 sel1 repeat family protein [Rhodospirillaceae bacterium]MBT6364472.1 sel1 repeat family protein [Rhodospirillaceae bacterium]